MIEGRGRARLCLPRARMGFFHVWVRAHRRQPRVTLSDDSNFEIARVIMKRAAIARASTRPSKVSLEAELPRFL